MKRLLSREDAFTGLEAAIVLIAFVVVAAVFSYVVLGAGFFTTQKSQAVVQQGVQQASSSMQPLGSVYGIDLTGTTGTAGTIDYLNFTIGLAPGGMPIDMTKTTMVYYNGSVRTQLSQDPNSFYNCSNPGPGDWCIADVVNLINGSSPTYLQSTEQMDIRVHLTESASIIAPRDTFTLEIKPILGPSLSITRTAPGGINQVQALY